MNQKCLVVLLLLIPWMPACEAGSAPGAPLTDVSATNIENTGPFEVVERSVVDDVLRVKVRAAVPEAAQRIAEHVLYQARHTAPRGAVIEVYAAEGETGRPLAKVESFRQPAGVTQPRPSAAVPSPADRLGVPGQRP